jgi:hypothetical protein
MACDIDDREGESPSPMEPRPGRMFHSSATGHRREQLFLRRSVFVKQRNESAAAGPEGYWMNALTAGRGSRDRRSRVMQPSARECPSLA